MNHAGRYFSPSSGLPPVRSLGKLTEPQIFSALGNLHSLYCPLRLPLSFSPHIQHKRRNILSAASTPVDSGYASGYASDDESKDPNSDIDALRADSFERNYAIRWLTGLIARAEELHVDSEDTKERIVDDAAAILGSFCEKSDQSRKEEDSAIRQSFSFPVTAPNCPTQIHVSTNDAPLSNSDHTDVGLQSWGAAVRMAELICADPGRFEIVSPRHARLESSKSFRVVELGAGTGIVSLVLAKLLPFLHILPPTIVATDYHPAVLANLQQNIETNFSSSGNGEKVPVQPCILDWSTPVLKPPLHEPADILVAADVVYAPEHAGWLKNCAEKLLDRNGVFWLLVTVRQSGKFVGLDEAVETAFDDTSEKNGDGSAGYVQRLAILHVERLEKRKGVGRGDECWYKLYRIGWVAR